MSSPRRKAAIVMMASMAGLAAACAKSSDKTADSTAAARGTAAAPQGAASQDTMMTSPAKPNDQMQAVLTQLAALGGKPIETLTPAEARKQPTPSDAVKALMASKKMSTAPDPAVKTVDRMIPGAAGNISARVYTPAGATGPLPVVVYYHGGGWVIANKDVYDAGPRAISKLGNVIVLSVDYRLAPEHKFPAAHDDALAAYEWARKNAASIGGDPTNVSTAGESAGGNLAVATAMSVRDRGEPMPNRVISIYPVAGTDTTVPSFRENANAKPLNAAMMGWFVKYATNSGSDLKDPRLDLVHANLKGLPPTTVITDQIDPLRSGGQMLSDALKKAGITVRYKNYDGVAHEFFGMGAVVDAARDAEQFAADGLK